MNLRNGWDLLQMAYLIPGTLLILLGGSVADHFGGRRIAIIGQLLAALMAAGLALTMWLTELTYPLFILFAISMGCAQAILTPARDGLLPVVAGGMIQRRVMQASLIQFGMQMVGLLLASLTDSIGVLYMLAGQSVILLVGVMAYAKLDIVTPTTLAVRNQFCKATAVYGVRGIQKRRRLTPYAHGRLAKCGHGTLFHGVVYRDPSPAYSRYLRRHRRVLVVGECGKLTRTLSGDICPFKVRGCSEARARFDHLAMVRLARAGRRRFQIRF